MISCEDIGTGSPMNNILKQIALRGDYVICDRLPFFYDDQGSIKTFPETMVYVSNWTNTFQSWNPNFEVSFGPFAWPSDGVDQISGLDSISIPNLRFVWSTVTKWSLENKIKTVFFEAFDQPYINNYNVKDLSSPEGRHGALAHLGLWRRVGTDDDYSYVEKIVEAIKSNKKGDGNSKTNTNAILAIAITLCILAGIFLVVIIMFMRQKNILSKEELMAFFNDDEKQSESDYENENPSSHIPYNKSYEIGDGDLIIDKYDMLGSGEFGIVFKGIHLEKSVAVKTLKADHPKREDLLGLMSELKTIMYLGKHEHLVSLIGAQTKYLHKGVLNVVVELCPNGCLSEWLAKNRDVKETKEPTLTHQLTTWAHQICLAMDYLEKKHVVHGDLAARNVLLTENLEAKVSDFGLSRKLCEYVICVKKDEEPLPWRWMAIESLERLEFTHKTDVWAFGVTLWEMFTMGDTPYPGMSYTTDFASKLSNGLRLHSPKLASKSIINVMDSCWRKTPEDRPNFSTMKKLVMTALNAAQVHEEYTMLETNDLNSCPSQAEDVTLRNLLERKSIVENKHFVSLKIS